MPRRPAWRLAAGALGALLIGVAGRGDAQQDSLARLAALETELAALEHEIERLEASKAIKRLQRAYGYYADKKLVSELGALFARDATVEIGQSGVYVGRERITEFYRRLLGGEGLTRGELFNHMILQGVVHVSDDAQTAKGRWRALIQIGQHGETAIWAEGPYENEYVKEDGVWKFSKVHWYQTVSAPYDPGWHKAPQPMSGPLEDFPPDRPPTEVYESYPSAYQPPYHYANPVSGRCEPGVCNADQ
ncbi:MAG TPA: nuclear transport factor 2 family protein [Gammaproteobacteria bacterium]